MIPKRPAYETEDDLRREQSVSNRLQAAWNCSIEKLPVRYEIDWAIYRDSNLKAFAELKCRNHPFGKYPSLMLSLMKWTTGKSLARHANVPFIIVAKFSDCLAYCETQQAAEIVWSGRKDRNDPQDLEPVVLIPKHQFKVIP